MTARIVLLMAAVIGLAACESTKVADTAPTTVATAPAPVAEPTPSVVRSPLVPDDDVATVASSEPKPRAKRQRSSAPVVAEMAPIADPDPVTPVEEPAKPMKPEKTAKAGTPAKPEKADKPDPVTTADATPPASTPPADTTTPTDGAPTPADTAPESGDAATAEVATADGADDTAFSAKRLLSDPASVMKMQIAGFPVWLIALVALIILAALIIGFGGRRKSEEVV